MTLDRIKTSTGRKLRGEALQETVLPIPYDAAAMPGATVLGTDGQLYVSQKDSPTSNYEWLRGIASVRLRTNIIQNISGGGGTPYAPFFQIEGVGATSPSQSIVAVNGTASLVLGAVSGTEIGDNGALTPSSIASGALLFHGSDGTNLYSMARINCLPGGTFDTQVTPGLLQLGVRLKGSTAGIQNILRIDGDGNVLIGNTTGTEKLEVTGNIKASGALIGSLLRVGSARDNFLVAPANPVVYIPAIQVEGANDELSTLAITRSTDGGAAPSRLLLCRARGAAGDTIVQDGDSIANLMFLAHDGTWLRPASAISTFVEGTPVAGDSVPGSMRFRTAPAGGQLMVRMWLTSDGNLRIGNTTGTERLSVTGNIQLTDTADSFKVGTNNVVGSRKTGWAAPTGTATRTTFATYAGQDASATYVEAEVQAIDDHVKVLSERLKALIDDLTSHGLIGPTPA